MRGSAMHPAQPAALIRFPARFRNPAPQDAVAFGVQLRFLRVIGAMIQNAAALRMENQLLRIEFARFPTTFPAVE